MFTTMADPSWKYKLSVGAIFRNEAHCLKEWIEHYMWHGAEHFYLVNDQSTDNYAEILEPYRRKGLITLNSPIWSLYEGRQFQIYNAFILPHLKETHWLLMVDLDEFMWSPISRSLYDVLLQTRNIGQIQVEHTLFGSSHHKEQPKELIKSFTWRAKDSPTQAPGMRKYFISSVYDVVSLNVHHATFANVEHEKHNFILLSEQYFVLNHYNCQSESFWRDVKCTRGDVNNYKTRTMADFAFLDQNDVEDIRLRDQNADIVPLPSVSYALCLMCVKPNPIWLDFLAGFKGYDVFIMVDDNNVDLTEFMRRYPTLRFIQANPGICQCAGYHHSNTTVYPAYVTIAWDKAIYLFSELETSYSYVWLIEEDVFFKDESVLRRLDLQWPSSDILMEAVTERSYDAKQPWDWHWCNVPFDESLVSYDKLGRGMVAAVRVSKEVFQRCADYAQRNCHRRLMYIEVLFPSLARQAGLQVDTPPELSTIQWQANWPSQTLNSTHLYHPVKSVEDHQRLRQEPKN